VKLQPPGLEDGAPQVPAWDVARSVQVWTRARDAAAVARTVATHTVSRLR